MPPRTEKGTYVPGNAGGAGIACHCFFRESKYDIRVLRVVACVRKFLYTVTQKMRLHKLKLAKMIKKKWPKLDLEPRTAERPPPKKNGQNRRFLQCFTWKNWFSIKTLQIGVFQYGFREKNEKFYVTFFPSTGTPIIMPDKVILCDSRVLDLRVFDLIFKCSVSFKAAD